MHDVYLHLPEPYVSSNISTPPEALTLAYFITGNPGLIGYYTTFLDSLKQDRESEINIVGASLGGFETRSITVSEGNETESESLKNNFFYPPSFRRKPIYSLQEQTSLSFTRLNYIVEHLHHKHKHASGETPAIKVILAGHSVGAHIALEIVRQRYEERQSTSHNYKIVATMLLTPTIHDIALSPSGKIATPILSNLPFFPSFVQAGAGVLTGTMPASWLKALVSRTTGMQDGSEALETTLEFLRMPGAVKQALYMARCEMAEIREGKWEEEIWGASEGERSEGEGGEMEGDRVWKPPKHYFLFAKQDHWVADATRDAILKAVGGRARIVVDGKDGEGLALVHAWCLRQSESVAGLVKKWLRDILKEASSGEGQE